jgi:branched-subunit amino acid transport protein
MININYFLLNVIALTIGTIAIRGSFIALSGKMHISAKVKDLFTYIPAAILPALVIPATFFHLGQVEWLAGKERFIILLLVTIAVYFYRNTLFVIVLGLFLLYAATNLN